MENLNDFWEELNSIVERYTDEDSPISRERAKELIEKLNKESDHINLDPEQILAGTVEDYNEDGIISYNEYFDTYDSSYDTDEDYTSPSY